MSALRTEKIIVGEGTEYPLNGLLTLLDSIDERVPAVVLVHGSGASDKDERVYKLTPFRDLAEGLAEREIASIRYDKRSLVYGRKMRKRLVTVREETIDDAVWPRACLSGTRASIPTMCSSSATAWARCWLCASTRRAVFIGGGSRACVCSDAYGFRPLGRPSACKAHPRHLGRNRRPIQWAESTRASLRSGIGRDSCRPAFRVYCNDCLPRRGRVGT